MAVASTFRTVSEVEVLIFLRAEPHASIEHNLVEPTRLPIDASKAALLYNDGGAAVRLTSVFASRHSKIAVNLAASRAR